METTGKHAGERPQSAPLGVKVIAVLGIIGGLLGLIGSAGFTAIGGTFGVVLGLVFAAFSIAVIAVNAALLSLKQWAWKAAIVLNGLSGILDLVQLNVIGFVIAVVIVAYLYSKAEYFYR